ncbi:MAG: histidine phosphatase family protein [Pseudomonadota bacterium]|nr:histidine phosphatase family protein [Pseudomonadota bacterium]
MLRFYLLRHAKSSWAEPGQPDIDRTLSPRGAGDLPRIAGIMQEKGYLPDHVYCSPTLRTRLTLHGIMSAFDQPPVVDYVETLYAGGVTAYFDCLRQHARAESLMIIGHNPMCEGFSAALAASGEPGPLAAMSVKYPTGALAVFDIDVPDWSRVGNGTGHLVDFVVPREI